MSLKEHDIFVKAGFSPDQITEIEEGRKVGLNVTFYANKKFLPIQMRQIRLGLAEHLPVEHYAKVEYDWFQMEEIREGLKSGVDISVYAKPEIPYEKMRQLRKGLEKGINLYSYIHLDSQVLRQLRKARVSGINILDYIQQGYDADQLNEIRIAIEKGVDLKPYLFTWYRAAAIAEIRIGLEHGVDVDRYATGEYGWQQMREIRKGLELQLDVEQYISPLYFWKQMREIRKGLEKGLDVSSYRLLRNTAAEMRKKRLTMLDAIYQEQERELQSQIRSEDFLFEIVSNGMEAYITVLTRDKQVNRKRLMELLEENNICMGIQEDVVTKIVNGGCHDKAMLIARGQIPHVGEDGWYEFFFRTEIERKPKILADGTADYHNMDWFEMVKVGQKLAVYHPAKDGIDGYSVTGTPIKARKGAEKRILKGKGFKLEADKKTYTATIEGMIRLEDEEMNITNHMLLDEVNIATGDISFNGSIHITGDVGHGAVIRATDDIVIDGTVESARIECGGSVVLKKGMNSAGAGLIQAERDVVSRFFESVKVVAKGNIEVDKCLNSQLYAEGFVTSSGVIVGGVTRAGAGIRLKNVGNQAGLYTALQLKANEKVMEEKHIIRKAIKDVVAEMDMLNKSYEEYKEKFAPEIRNEMPIFIKLEKAVYTKSEQLKQLITLDDEIEQMLKKVRNAKIIVSGCAHEGTTVEMEGCRWEADNQWNIIISRKDEQVEVLSN